MAYPDILLQKLASGVGVVGVNPLLVGQDGTSYIPNGTILNTTLADKANPIPSSIIYSDNSGVTYSVLTGRTNSSITNYINVGGAVGALNIVSYTSKNQPYIQTTPKPVVEVEPKVIATNSHSVYKGALVGNQVAGKIQVGNGANGYESKVLENGEVVYDYDIRYATSNGFFIIGKTIDLVTGKVYLGNGINGEILVRRVGSTLYNYVIPSPGPFDIDDTNWSNKVGYTSLIPTHQTIALDSSTSSASKYFNTLAEDTDNTYAQVFGEEITYDGVGLDWGDTDFTQLTNGTLPDVNGGNDVRTFCGLIPLNIGVK